MNINELMKSLSELNYELKALSEKQRLIGLMTYRELKLTGTILNSSCLLKNFARQC